MVPLAAGITAWLLVRPAAWVREPRVARSWPVREGTGLAAVVGALVGVATLGGVTGGGLGAGAGVLAARAARSRERRRAETAVRRAVPDVLRLLAAELQAGVSPHAALASSGVGAPAALAEHLRAVSAGARLGVDPADALAPGPIGAEGLSALAACWRVSQTSGASLGAGVARLAGGLAAEDRCRAEVEAQLAGPRASATVLATLPLVAVAMAVGLGASPVAFFRTTVGTGCLLTGLALDLAGLRWTKHLAAGAMP